MLLLRVVLNTTTLYVVVYTILTSTNMFLRHWLRFSTGEPKVQALQDAIIPETIDAREDVDRHRTTLDGNISPFLSLT